MHLLVFYSGALLESSANELIVGFASYTFSFPHELSLYVTTTEVESVNFTISAVGFSFTGVATRESSVQVEIPNTFEVRLEEDDCNEGFRIKAEGDSTVIVYGLSHGVSTADVFLALPCGNLAVDEYEISSTIYGIAYFRSMYKTQKEHLPNPKWKAMTSQTSQFHT